MKKLIAFTLVICLLLCGCQTAEPALSGKKSTKGESETTPETGDASLNTPDPTTVPATEPATEPATQPSTESGNVLVYQVVKAEYHDGSYTEYAYDSGCNLHEFVVSASDDTLLRTFHFREKGTTGMPTMLLDIPAHGEDVLYSATYHDDGRINEVMQQDKVYTGFQFDYNSDGNMTAKREYDNGILVCEVIYEYQGKTLTAAYCQEPRGEVIYECKVENGRIVEKTFHAVDGDYSSIYEYDANGNLVKEHYRNATTTYVEVTYTYRTVEVDAQKAATLLKQQAYLLSVT